MDYDFHILGDCLRLDVELLASIHAISPLTMPILVTLGANLVELAEAVLLRNPTHKSVSSRSHITLVPICADLPVAVVRAAATRRNAHVARHALAHDTAMSALDRILRVGGDVSRSAEALDSTVSARAGLLRLLLAGCLIGRSSESAGGEGQGAGDNGGELHRWCCLGSKHSHGVEAGSCISVFAILPCEVDSENKELRALKRTTRSVCAHLHGVDACSS